MAEIFQAAVRGHLVRTKVAGIQDDFATVARTIEPHVSVSWPSSHLCRPHFVDTARTKVDPVIRKVEQPEPVVVTKEEPPVVRKEEPPVVIKEEPPVTRKEEPVIVSKEAPEPVVITKEEPPIVTKVEQPESTVVTKEEPEPAAREEPDVVAPELAAIEPLPHTLTEPDDGVDAAEHVAYDDILIDTDRDRALAWAMLQSRLETLERLHRDEYPPR